MKDYVKEKIKILKDFYILTNKKDINRMETLLSRCTTEIQMDHKIHDLICGKETLKQFFNRNEGIKK